MISPGPAGAFIAGPEGRKRTPAYGCPLFSLGEPYYVESMLAKGHKVILDWLEDASHPGYKNPTYQLFTLGGSDDEDEGEGEDDETPWNSQDKLNASGDWGRVTEL